MAELDRWRDLAAIARDMAHTAATHDWDALISHNTRFQQSLATLRPALSVPLTAADRGEKATLIRAILADYERVREKVGPWMADVRPMLDAWPRTGTTP